MARDGCHKVSVLLSGYLDGELSPRKRALVEAHLKGCPLCSAELLEMRRAGALIVGAIEAEASDAPLGRLWDRVAARAPREERPWYRPLRWLTGFRPAIAVGVAAAIVLALVTTSRIWVRPGAISNEVNILSIENPGPGVMVFKSAEADMTVIWVLD